MQSVNLHSPSIASVLSLNSRANNKPNVKGSHLSYSSSCEDIFSNVLLTLRSCTEQEDPQLGSCFHAKILKLGIDDDVFIGNSLLNMYSKCDHLYDAQKLFDHMPQRDIASWTSMMSSYCRNYLADESTVLFSRMLEVLQPNEFTLAVVLQACAQKVDGNLAKVIHGIAIKVEVILDEFLRNSLIDAYAKSGMLRAAEGLLLENCRKDVVSWTSVISGCISNGHVNKALDLFFSMQKDGVMPNEITMLSILQACSEINSLKIFLWIFGLVLKGNWGTSHLVVNSLIEMYSTNGYFHESMMIFCYFSFNGQGLYPSSKTMANLLHGCANSRKLNLGKAIHGYLIKHKFLPYTTVENSLMNMYVENGSEDSTFLIFKTMAKRDIISWNTIIRCFVKNEKPIDALRLLSEVHRENGVLDFVTMLTSLQACSDLASLVQGQVIHCYLTKTGMLSDTFICNSLIDMHAKSGRLDFAEKIFQEMPEKDLGSWNSIIAAYGNNGDGKSALKTFADLKKLAKPNAISFINIFSACAHGGFIEEGFEIFNSMETHYGVKPNMEHFACIVDMLGRAGRVEEAETFICTMPLEPSSDVWGALLSACVVFGNLTIAERAVKRLAILEPNSSIWRVALSNAYAAAGKWDKVVDIRSELKQSKKLKKERGWSSINIEGCEYFFKVGDTNRGDSMVIYEALHNLLKHMQDASVSYMS